MFLSELHTKHIDGRIFELLEPLIYETWEKEIITVPKGFISDGASIPKICWSIIGHPMGEYAPAAWIHDFLFVTQPVTRKEADRIFIEAMADLGVAFWKRKTMHFFVRICGWGAWQKYKFSRNKISALRNFHG